MSSLGTRIKEERVRRDWTQEELCAKAGISKGFLSDVENGKQRIGADPLLEIARALDVSLDYLMKGESSEVRRREIQIPDALAKLAEEKELRFKTTLTLLDMRKQILAHRNAGGRDDDESFNWSRFYESMREYLDD